MAIYALRFPVYQPAMRVILSITNSFPAIIVTTIDGINPAANDYITGTIVRLDIPTALGMVQADQKTGIVTVINSTTFSIDIDTTYFDPYVVPGLPNRQRGQVVPIGEINSILTASTINVL